MTALGIVFRPQIAPEKLRAVAEAADRYGVDELWLWEDCFDEGGISMAAAALAWTERLRVAVGVLPVPLRNAALTAMEIATLCRLFLDRVEIGLGHGVQEWMDQVGARVGSPMTLLREYVAVVQSLLAGDTVSADGLYVHLRDVSLGWPPAHRPGLHVGAVKPKTIALAGEIADGVVLTGGSTPDDVHAARQVYDTARANRAGRVTVYVMTTTGADARAKLEAESRHWEHEPRPDLGVAGTAEAIAAGVRRYAAAGTDAVILQPRAEDDPVEFARFVGTEVRPLLQ